jgi:hypothetical protein
MNMKEILSQQYSQPFFAEFLPDSLLAVSAGYCQTTLVDESGVIRNAK